MMLLQTLGAPTTLGPGAQIALKLIDQLPAILTAAGLLATALVGFLNYRRLGEVKTQNDGHMSVMIENQKELSKQLANSVPSATLTAVIDAGAAAASAVAATHADRPTEKTVQSLDNIDASTKAIDKNTRTTRDDVRDLKEQ